MEIRSEIKTEHIEEVIKANYPKEHIRTVHVIAVIFLVLAVVTFFRNNFGTAAITCGIYILGALGIEIILYRARKKAVKTSKIRWMENTKGQNMVFHYRFDEDVLHIQNITSGGHMDMAYDNFKKYIETEHYALLLTKGRQYVALEKAVAQEHDIEGFVKARCKK